jgi:hypothetical protein
VNELAPRRRAGSPAAILVLTIVGYPVAASVSLFTGLPNRTLSIAMRGAVVLLALDVLLRRFLARGRVPVAPFWIAWYGFWTLYLARMLLDGVLAPGVLRLTLGEYLLWAVGQCLVPASAQAGGTNDLAMRRALWATIVLGAGAAAATLWVLVVQGDVVSALALALGRASTESLNPISLGHLGATVLILSLWRLTADDVLGSARSAALIAAAGVGATALLLASSRGPILALVAVLPLLLARSRRPTKPRGVGRAVRLLLPTAALCAALVWVWQNREGLNAFRRVSSGLFEDSARRELLTGAFALIARNPFTGAGTEPLGTYAHNVVVDAYLATGIVGGTLLVAILAMALRAALRVRRERPEWSWTTLLFVQYLVAAMFSGSLYESGAMWVLAAVAVSQRELLGGLRGAAPTIAPTLAAVTAQRAR